MIKWKFLPDNTLDKVKARIAIDGDRQDRTRYENLILADDFAPTLSKFTVMIGVKRLKRV